MSARNLNGARRAVRWSRWQRTHTRRTSRSWVTKILAQLMLAIVATSWLSVAIAWGQSPDQQAVPARARRGRPAARQPDQPPNANPTAGEPASGGAPAEDAKAGEAKEKPSDEKAEEPNDSIKRPTVPPRVPDPREFDARPDANARIQFAFHGQLWPDVLQWFATISGYSLDWQELPNDYIHLATNRQISLPEVRDLLNRLLFERGYTMVVQRDVLLVVKVSKLDPSLLRRVEDEAELMDLPAYDFVKITFALPEKLKADKAAEDVKPFLSQHAKAQPLMATNRLLVIDLVANLRDVSRLINSEHAAAIGNTVPREFTIRFARADHVADQVMILLGLDPSSRRTPQELQVEQQRLQLFSQMQQKGADVTKYLRGDSAPKVFLAVNHRNNSVLANAPPEEMALIERAVTMLDVPSGTLTGAAPAELTLQRYQLVTLKPESLVTALEDIGELDPRTRLKMDSDARSVYAQAPPIDHEKIQSLIDKLDGTGRQFEVIWLRRLPADAVAATVQKLMVGKDEEKDDNNNGYPYYFSYRRSQPQQESPDTGFRVDADIENNRLLLWASEEELKEVRKFLAKLGEIAGGEANPHTVRTLEPRDPEATLQLLEQLRRAWPSIGSNPLRIEVQPSSESPTDEHRSRPDKPGTEPDEQDEALHDSSPSTFAASLQTSVTMSIANDSTAVAMAPTDALAEWTVAQRTPQSVPKSVGAEQNMPPRANAEIVISVTPDGRLLLSSRDTQALDMLEEVIARIAPAAKTYEVFYLKHALASLVTLNLEEYFEEDSDSKSNNADNYWRGWYGIGMSNGDKETTRDLGVRRNIRFIYDFDTNSILVSNASAAQLETVRQLIEVYDRPISEESVSARRFKIFTLRFARAEDVAETIKDVYRDLLSSKDKAFTKNQTEKEQTSQSSNFYRIFGSSDSEDKKPKKVKASFAGALSVGVDARSNTLIVSAQEEWLPSIAEMIRFLDEQAEPVRPAVEVVNTRVSPSALQAALSRALGESSRQVQIKEGAQEEAGKDEAKQPSPDAANGKTASGSP